MYEYRAYTVIFPMIPLQGLFFLHSTSLIVMQPVKYGNFVVNKLVIVLAKVHSFKKNKIICEHLAEIRQIRGSNPVYRVGRKDDRNKVMGSSSGSDGSVREGFDEALL